MRRLVSVLMLLLCAAALSVAQAQLEAGDPPVASLISVSTPDENGVVTVSGAAGAVFPAAQVAIRNLFTEEVVFVQAGITGGFRARIYGPGATPFWVSPTVNFEPAALARPGSLPVGPGTIVYGTVDNLPLLTHTTTNLFIDGNLDDWAAYPEAAAEGEFFALANDDSLYLAAAGVEFPPEAPQLRVTFSLDGAVYDLSFNASVLQAGTLRRLSPNPTALGTVALAVVQNGGTLELRLRWRGQINPNNPSLEEATFDRLQAVTVDSAGTEVLLADYVVEMNALLLDEADGVVRHGSLIAAGDVTPFYVAGPLAQGASIWSARGRVGSMELDAGDTLTIEMDMTLDVPQIEEPLVGLQISAQLSLQPVVNEDGLMLGGLLANNGWSSTLTPGGLAIEGLRGDLLLAEVNVPAQQVVWRDGQLLFPLDFAVTLPEDLAPGVYVPALQGFAQLGNDPRFRWEDNGLFGVGRGVSPTQLHRLPLALNIDRVDEGRFLWALFYDDPSDGSRGLLPEDDAGVGALANRVRYNSPTYILPPGSYPIEPYLLNLMPNSYDTSAAPLLQILLGRLEARITAPDGETQNLGSVQIVQNQLSTSAEDERDVFGRYAPLDVYRVTTLNPQFTNYAFEQYGAYSIRLEGSVEDVWGNRFEGGGTYRLLIAEPIDVTPYVLPGTPFEVGDAFNAGVHVIPGLAAEVRVRLRVFPLDGSEVVEYEFGGTASVYGTFQPTDAPPVFDVPGEYIADYEVRYTAENGQLWAGSLRGAGVIAGESTLIAHGERGMYPNTTLEDQRAWYDAARYAPNAPFVNYPYQHGDIAWVADGNDSGLRALLRAQDSAGNYAGWLAGALAAYVSPEGLPFERLNALDALPLEYSAVNQAYSYISAVRPGVTARQAVLGSDDPAYPVAWDMDDPYNSQLGAGALGDRPGDFTFLFGGNVVRNAEAGVADVSLYSALAMTVFDGSRVFPPYRGAAAGADGGPLLTLRGQEIEMFFHPTGTQPGQVLHVGEMLTVAGQVAPPLNSLVQVTITAPSGMQRQFSGTANAIGYFYDPGQDFAVDESGLWTVDISVSHRGLSSAGMAQPPYPLGGVLGAPPPPNGLGGRYVVYVVAPGTPQLESPQAGDDFTQPLAALNFAVDIPDDWSDVRAYQTITMPGYILSSGEINVSVRTVTFQYNPQLLNLDFPMLEIDSRPNGPSASDVVRVTLVLTGTDASGQFVIRARTYTVLHDRLVSLGA
ncbi:MAG: hypothetical protein HXY40_17590 [Chloroflexi bacterium]|nr:hypothetical protein [Chloroflexota bacterium]